MINNTFTQLPLSKELIKAIDDLGFEEATPIQAEAIPHIINGNDIIGLAHTGTGKTAAYGLPAIDMLENNSKTVQILVLLPTRELAIQVAEDFTHYGKYKKDFSLLPIYGGSSYDRQFKLLKKGVKIIIGTPGRVIDHINRGTLKLEHTKLVVLDEADEMLNMGFREDIENILTNTPEDRQTVMFSATMSKGIMNLTKKFQKNPITVKVIHEKLTVPEITQVYYEVRQRNKLDALTNILDLQNTKLALIFCNTKKSVDELVEKLQVRGYSADGLHGDMKQNVREKVMDKFRKGKVELLAATDVAARGLDVDNIEIVFNYDLPQDEEYYVHRIGRTGRAGKLGKAITFVSDGFELSKLKNIQKFTNTKIKLEHVPTYNDIAELRISSITEEIKKIIKTSDLTKYIKLIEEVVDADCTSLDIAAALLKEKLNLSESQAGKREDFSERFSIEPIEENRSSYRRNRSRSRASESSRSRSGRSNSSKHKSDSGDYRRNNSEKSYSERSSSDNSEKRNFSKRKPKRDRTKRSDGEYRGERSFSDKSSSDKSSSDKFRSKKRRR